MNADLKAYYKQRAKEYEKIYDKPERQRDLRIAEKVLQHIFAQKEVLEIACGTGFWTEKISRTAHSIFATDINETVIDVAKTKKYHPAPVEFQTMDFYGLNGDKEHESLFGGFIWSHIKLQHLNKFIDKVNGLVKSGGTVVFMDNIYVEGSNLPITSQDSRGNMYQTRKLSNGTTHKVLKNFPEETFIRQLLVNKVIGLDFTNLKYFWILKYTIQ